MTKTDSAPFLDLKVVKEVKKKLLSNNKTSGTHLAARTAHRQFLRCKNSV